MGTPNRPPKSYCHAILNEVVSPQLSVFSNQKLEKNEHSHPSADGQRRKGLQRGTALVSLRLQQLCAFA
jgi:hypothetical protein